MYIHPSLTLRSAMCNGVAYVEQLQHICRVTGGHMCIAAMNCWAAHVPTAATPGSPRLLVHVAVHNASHTRTCIVVMCIPTLWLRVC